MSYHAPDEELLNPEDLSALQRRKLSNMLRAVLPTNAFYRGKLAGLKSAADAPLSDLPFTTRAELQQDQIEHPPYGTNLTHPLDRYIRLHQTSGSAGVPLRWLDTADDWTWWRKCWGMIYRAAGLTPADRLIFTFSFGPFIGFWSAFDSALSLGNMCLAAGGMTTLARLRHLLDNDVTFVCCTPTYALRMAETAAAEGIDLAGSKVRGLIVAGEPGGAIPATRERIERAWGARVFDHWGMTEVGPLAFECVEAPGELHVNEAESIAEVIHPQSGRPVPEGEPGELVMTNLGRWGAPVIRYRTGDQVVMRRARCACGRWFARLEGGILGRIDDMLIIRGNNVFPSAIEGILRSFADVVEFRTTVVTREGMSELKIEVEPSPGVDGAALTARVAQAIRDRLHFRPDVTAAPPGTLPRYEMKSRRMVRDGAGTP